MIPHPRRPDPAQHTETMSFIVEATRRQQQDTVPAEAAGIAYERVRLRERRIWMVVGLLIATGLILTGAIIVKWLFLAPAAGPQDTSGFTTTAPRIAAPVPETVQPAPALPVIESVEDVGTDTSWYQPVEPPEDIAPPVRTPIRLREAPADIRDDLMAMRYSSHLYTDVPGRRSLTVNGKRMREGEASGDWALAEITPEGAIWDNGDLLVDVPVLELWD